MLLFRRTAHNQADHSVPRRCLGRAPCFYWRSQISVRTARSSNILGRMRSRHESDKYPDVHAEEVTSHSSGSQFPIGRDWIFACPR